MGNFWRDSRFSTETGSLRGHPSGASGRSSSWPGVQAGVEGNCGANSAPIARTSRPGRLFAYVQFGLVAEWLLGSRCCAGGPRRTVDLSNGGIEGRAWARRHHQFPRFAFSLSAFQRWSPCSGHTSWASVDTFVKSVRSVSFNLHNLNGL
jgi:hypothetical protein